MPRKISATRNHYKNPKPNDRSTAWEVKLMQELKAESTKAKLSKPARQHQKIPNHDNT